MLNAGTVESLCMKPYVTLPLEPSSASTAWTCRTKVPAGWFSRTDVLSRYCWHWGERESEQKGQVGGREDRATLVWRKLDQYSILSKVKQDCVGGGVWFALKGKIEDDLLVGQISLTWTQNKGWIKKERRKPESYNYSIHWCSITCLSCVRLIVVVGSGVLKLIPVPTGRRCSIGFLTAALSLSKYDICWSFCTKCLVLSQTCMINYLLPCESQWSFFFLVINRKSKVKKSIYHCKHFQLCDMR